MALCFNKGPYIMGIVNVTPDSFSDGGQFVRPDKAIEHGLRLIEQGADILDIGGESTRPGADPVSVQQEIDRVIPVIEGLKGCNAVISIDTVRPETMREAVAVGVSLVNDISALQSDLDSLSIVAGLDVSVCLMHMQGVPRTMQENPHYNDVVAAVFSFLDARIQACVAAGISKSRIMIDPGIGFGKNLEHNLALLKNIAAFKSLGVPVLLGASRKSFIEGVCRNTPADRRLPGSLAAALWGLQQGVDIFRVHDVAETKQAFVVYEAIKYG